MLGLLKRRGYLRGPARLLSSQGAPMIPILIEAFIIHISWIIVQVLIWGIIWSVGFNCGSGVGLVVAHTVTPAILPIQTLIVVT